LNEVCEDSPDREYRTVDLRYSRDGHSEESELVAHGITSVIFYLTVAGNGVPP